MAGDGTVFVSGATGVLGRPVVRLLVDSGREVRALARSPGNEAALRAAGAEPVRTDLFDPPSLSAALAGANGARVEDAHKGVRGGFASARWRWLAAGLTQRPCDSARAACTWILETAALGARDSQHWQVACFPLVTNGAAFEALTPTVCGPSVNGSSAAVPFGGASKRR